MTTTPYTAIVITNPDLAAILADLQRIRVVLDRIQLQLQLLEAECARSS